LKVRHADPASDRFRRSRAPPPGQAIEGRRPDPALARQVEEEQALLLPLIEAPRWVAAAA